MVGYVEAPDNSYEEVYLLNSFATGVVTGDSYTGGLVGSVSDSLGEGYEENLYYADSTMQEVCDSIEYLITCAGTSLENLYNSANEPYDGGNWDSEDVWYFDGISLPVLAWEPVPVPEPEEEEPTPSRSSSSGSRASRESTTSDSTNSSYTQEVAEVLEKKVVTENPENSTNKCEALTIMSRVFNWEVPTATTSKYTDVPEWCISVAAYGTDRGIVEGRTATTLGMETPVTRYEIAVMLYRELQKQNYEFKGTNEVTFSDELIPWAKEAVETLAKEGILKQDAAIMMLRFLKKKVDYTSVDDSRSSSRI